MELDGNKALFASIVGSAAVDSLPRFAKVQNKLENTVLPTIPFLGKFENWTKPGVNEDDQFFPLRFKRTGTNDPFYTFPYEPLITINGKNIITKRYPAKFDKNSPFIGSIKERWAQDDYQIRITGAFYGENLIGSVGETFPRKDFEKLRDYCTWPQGLTVQCEPLQLLGINNITVEDFTFPFTKGENVQAYEIKALSDFSANFLLEIEE